MSDLKLPLHPALLIDGEHRHSETPKTFKIPLRSDRFNVNVGDLVKIGVESPVRSGERFWVEVIARVDDGRYVGRVDNNLEDGWGFNLNDHVIFEPRHVLSMR